MEDFLIYIGKASIAAGVFYLAYLLLFQKHKQFSFNRIYLPISLMLSFVIPLITFTTVKYVELPKIENSGSGFTYLSSVTSGEHTPVPFVFEWYHYLFGMYILGITGFLLNLLFGHFRAIHIIRRSRIQELFNQLINITEKDVHPFSFFNKIVLSEKTLSSPDLEIIVSHEKIHVREKHTLDILFTEIMFLFQWFNPFVWLIKDAVKNNLEYKTDDQITKIYNSQKYQLAMVALADKKGVAPFLTALNGSQLKNRIVMMKKKTENKFAVVKQLIVLPLLAILVMGLSNKEVKTEFIRNSNKIETINPTIQQMTQNPIMISGEVTSDNGNPIPNAIVIIKGKSVGTQTDHLGRYKIKVSDGDSTLVFGAVGAIQKEIKIGNKREINIQLNFDNHPKDDEIIITPKEKQNIIKDNVIKKKEEVLKDIKTDSSGWKVSGGFKGVISPNSEDITFFPTTDKGITFSLKGDNTKKPLILLDSKEIENTNAVSLEDIGSVIVLKDKTSIEKYGEKGKNGVILLTTKAKSANSKTATKNDFLISVQYEQDKIYLQGLKGCVFKELTFSIKDNFPIAIDQFGMTSPNDNSRYIPGGTNSDFLFTIEKNHDLINLTGEKGTNWIALSFDAMNKKHFISETGVFFAKEGVDGPIFTKVDEMPEFPGGEFALRKWIAKEMKYPVIAQENGIQGKVYITFVVTKEGKVAAPIISKGVDPSLDKEALRVINTLPKWKPAEKDGEPVNVSYTFPVEFKLSDDQNKEGHSIDKVINKNSSASVIVFPKGFSPNGDGIHDIFEIRGLERKYPNFKMEIFNDNGNSIWEYKHNGDPNSTPEWWDGKDKMNNIKDGTYSYVIEYNDGSKGKTSGRFILATSPVSIKEINTILDLRKFIAEKIKYPVEAKNSGQPSQLLILTKIDDKGYVKIVHKKPDADYIKLDEVVVTTYTPENPFALDIKKIEQIYRDECERVINLLPKITVPELLNKEVGLVITFKFQN